MAYFYTDEEGLRQEVAIEPWVWGAIMKDGSEIKQFDAEKSQFNRFSDLKQEELSLVLLFKPEDFSKRIFLPVEEGMQVVLLKRTTIFEAATPEERRADVYVFGYKKGSASNFFYILPDDRIVMSQDFNLDFIKFGI